MGSRDQTQAGEQVPLTADLRGHQEVPLPPRRQQ